MHPTEGYDEEHANNLPKSKYVQEETPRRSRAVFPGFAQQKQQLSHLGYLINGDLCLILWITLLVEEVSFQ